MEKSPTPPKIRKKRLNNRLDTYMLKSEQRYRVTKDKKTVDLEQVSRLASIGCTFEEMAQILGVSMSWLSKEKDASAAMAMAIAEGQGKLKQSLRRCQLDMALSGSVPMLIWLGKQLLGQSDKQSTETKTEINITVQRAMEELRTIPRDQLVAAQALLEQGGGGVIENQDFSGVPGKGVTPV